MPERPERPASVVHSRRATWFVLLGFLAGFMPMPYNVVAIVALVAAGVETVRTTRAMRAENAPRKMRQWNGVSLVITIALIVLVGLPYAFWGATRGYQQCMSGANTQLAQASCKHDLADTNLLRSYVTGS